MSFELTGKLVAKFDIIQKTDTFKTREFVIEKSDDINGRIITNYIKFQCIQDKTTMPDRFNIGDEVKVLFNIKGTKWNKNGVDTFITNLDAWRMETTKLASTPETQPATTVVATNSSNEDLVDDLPF
jgi:hypothetical protein